MRTIVSGLILQAGPPWYLPRAYCIMSDGSIWYLATRDGVDWRPIQGPPGRVVTYLYALAPDADRYPDQTQDTLFAACDDGTIWSATVADPLTWIQVTRIPQG
jgi:hypothetical protein